MSPYSFRASSCGCSVGPSQRSCRQNPGAQVVCQQCAELIRTVLKEPVGPRARRQAGLGLQPVRGLLLVEPRWRVVAEWLVRAGTPGGSGGSQSGFAPVAQSRAHQQQHQQLAALCSIWMRISWAAGSWLSRGARSFCSSGGRWWVGAWQQEAPLRGQRGGGARHWWRGVRRWMCGRPARRPGRPGPGRSVAKAHRKLLFDRFCQQAAQGSWIDDVEAEQGGAV